MTVGVSRWASTQSPSRTAARAPGIQATTTLSQREIVFFLTRTPPPGFLPKGQSWFQNRKTTARMAPSWIT